MPNLKSISRIETAAGEDRPSADQTSAAANSTAQTIYSGPANFAFGSQYVFSLPTRTDEINLLPIIEYKEVAQTLNDMRDTADDGSNIDLGVYAASIEVASALFQTNIPAPSVFSHGPKSVVFNWDDGIHNLYLTIGKTRLWALASTAAGIKGQIELTDPSNNIAGDFLKALRNFSNKPMLLTGDVTGRRSVVK
jgi:hypothetical protein